MKNTIEWIKNDFKCYPFRFCVEFFAWCISIGCSITMAAYPIWIVGCGLYAWASYTRRSFGSNVINNTSINQLNNRRCLCISKKIIMSEITLIHWK